MVEAIENWNHESSKFTKAQIIKVQRSVKSRETMELLPLKYHPMDPL